MLGLAILAAAVVLSDRGAIMAKVFKKAMQQAGLSLKEAAYFYGSDPSLLNRELSGVGHVSLTRVANMPTPFVQWFALGMVTEFGLPVEVQVAQQIAERV